MRTSSTINAEYLGEPVKITIPFTDEASIQNAINCWCVMLHLQIPAEEIEKKMKGIHAMAYAPRPEEMASTTQR
jgi:alanine racemase